MIALDPDVHRTFYFWHVYVEGLEPACTTPGAWPGPGQPLDAAPELLDPWARAVSDARWDRSGRDARAGRRHEPARHRHRRRPSVGRRVAGRAAT